MQLKSSFIKLPHLNSKTSLVSRSSPLRTSYTHDDSLSSDHLEGLGLANLLDSNFSTLC